MNPDQTDSKKQSDLGPYCLTYRLPKYINEVVTGGNRAKIQQITFRNIISASRNHIMLDISYELFPGIRFT